MLWSWWLGGAGSATRWLIWRWWLSWRPGGDQRTLDQLRADQLCDRVTGDVHVEVVVPAWVLLLLSDDPAGGSVERHRERSGGVVGEDLLHRLRPPQRHLGHEPGQDEGDGHHRNRDEERRVDGTREGFQHC